MSDLLNLLGFRLEVNEECYEQSENQVVAISDYKKLVKQYKVTDNEEDVEVIARYLASTKALLLNIGQKIYNEAIAAKVSHSDAIEKVKSFYTNMLGIFNDPKILFPTLSALLGHYVQYLSDSKIDLDSVATYYSKHPDAYKIPHEYEVKVYTFNKSLDADKEELKEFMLSIKDKYIDKSVLSKFENKAKPTIINSLLVIDQSVLEIFYEAIENLNVGEISEPVFQTLGDNEVVFFLVLEKKTIINVVSKEDQAKRAITSCNFIAQNMMQLQVEQLVKDKKLIE